MSEPLNIIRIASHSRGRIGFDLGDGVTDWITPDGMAAYMESCRTDPRKWKIVALDEAVRLAGATWADVLTNERLRTRLDGSTADPPVNARVAVPPEGTR